MRPAVVDWRSIARGVEAELNASWARYSAQPESPIRTILGLITQLHVFRLDLVLEAITFYEVEADDFSSKVPLTGGVLRLYEFEIALRMRWLPTLQSACEALGVAWPAQMYHEVGARHREVLRKIRAWGKLRNAAAAHYGRFDLQLAAIAGLDRLELISAIENFLSYLQEIMEVPGATFEASGVLGRS